MFERRSSFLAALLSGVVLAGCGSDAAPATDSSMLPVGGCASETRAEPYKAGMTFQGSAGVVIALMDANPAPPHKGDNVWTLDIKGPDGNPIPDATITVTQLMVDHGHPGAKNPDITSLGGGSYKADPVNFNMSGFWETTFEVKTDTLDDKVDVKMCIP